MYMYMYVGVHVHVVLKVFTNGCACSMVPYHYEIEPHIHRAFRRRPGPALGVHVDDTHE